MIVQTVPPELLHLSATELRTFLALREAGGWVDTRDLRRLVWGDDAAYMVSNHMATVIGRLRARLRGSRWAVESAVPRPYGRYRLIEREAA